MIGSNEYEPFMELSPTSTNFTLSLRREFQCISKTHGSARNVKLANNRLIDKTGMLIVINFLYVVIYGVPNFFSVYYELAIKYFEKSLKHYKYTITLYLRIIYSVQRYIFLSKSCFLHVMAAYFISYNLISVPFLYNMN